MEVEFRGTSGFHNNVEDGKLESSEGTDHDATWSQADGGKVHETNLAGKDAETLHDGALAAGTSLINLGEKSVGWVRDDGSSDTGNDTGTDGDAEVGALAGFACGCAHRLVDGFGGGTLNGELGHCVRNLLQQDWAKTRVKATDDAFLRGELAGTVDETLCEGWVGDETDPGCFERAQEDVGNEFGHGGRCQVDRGLELPCTCLSKVIHKVNLEKLDTSELEPALDKVSDHGWAETSGKRANTFGGNDLTEAGNHTCRARVQKISKPKPNPKNQSQSEHIKEWSKREDDGEGETKEKTIEKREMEGGLGAEEGVVCLYIYI